MSGYIRLFQSAVDPADVEEVRRIFQDEIKPLFATLNGCRSIELIVNVSANVGGLVEGSALSRWDSLDQLEQAMGNQEVLRAQATIRHLLRQEPVTKTFEVLE